MASTPSMSTTSIHFLLDILTVMDLGCEQDRAVSDTTHASHMAPFVNTKGDFLDLSLTLPVELNGEWATLDSLRLACLQEFACFGGCTRHERRAILIAYIDLHTVCKTSCQSKMLLAIVHQACHVPITLPFQVPLNRSHRASDWNHISRCDHLTNSCSPLSSLVAP